MHRSDWSSYVCSSDLFFDAERREASAYPDSRFPHPASWLVDQERRAASLEEGEHYESSYHLALTWLPTAHSAKATVRSLIVRPYARKGRERRRALPRSPPESHRAFDLLATHNPTA